MSFVSWLWPTRADDDGSHSALVVVSTVIATAVALTFLRSALWLARPKTIAGPLRTLMPKLSEKEVCELDYGPDSFPGARDVASPYGSIRVYEWGPEDGPKVLFAHGISTSCMSLGCVAHALVAKGCRVMLFDLFGRGFSDGVGDVPHDERLYVSQMLLALASSPLSWTGAGRLRVVGYSMGGGVAAHLAAAFPHLVESLVLLAPAGVIRIAKFGVLNRLIFVSGLVPDRLLARLTAVRLRRPIAAAVEKKKKKKSRPTTPSPPLDAVQAAKTETSNASNDGEPEMLIDQKVVRYLSWMVRHHAGFIPAFMGSLSSAPLVGQEAIYRKLAERKPGSTVFILGESDELVCPEDYEEDVLPLVGGRDRVRWAVVPGGHDFPLTHANEALEHIYGAWGL